ncbi:MAG: PKD domain-containing protein [Bacteroidetes bacterium]|nr:MAG: PKD domain-containing protein [Bacteroidota bacterium]
MNNSRVFFILLFACLHLKVAFSTHIVGGELNYRQLTGNEYEITLTVYRDCFGGQAPFDDPASIGVFDDQGNLVASTYANITSQGRIPNLINSPCLTPPTNICYEVATYVYTTTLPPRPGGYQLVYQRCCRNYSVLNIYNVSYTGATYIATIPDSIIVAHNSNPIFNQLPPTFICEDAPFTFDHSATDPDGDSIVYEICVPLQGADQNNPRPQPPNAPPYLPIQWENSFSLANPFGGVPLTIDPRTGLLRATPSTSGQFVYGVCAKEYRNGVYLGETKRDFQANVVPCPMITVASIFSPTIVCGSLTAAFTNNSYNAATYTWDFGDLSTTLDTSTGKNPSWTYPDTGVYTSTLIAYSGINSLCNDTAYGIVKVYPIFFADFNVNNVHCSPDFEFLDASYGVGGLANFWKWDLGDGTTSSSPNVSHTYQQAGLYEISLVTSTDSSCLDTMIQTISVLEPPVAIFDTEIDTCTHTVMTHNSSTNTALSIWNFSGYYDVVGEEPQYRYLQEGVHEIYMVAFSDSSCIDTTVRLISLPPLPKANFNYSVTDCDSVVRFTNLSKNSIQYLWKYGDETESIDFSPTHTYSLSGSIPVKLVSTSVNNCSDTVSKDIYFISYKGASFATKVDSCSGLTRFVDVTDNAVAYLWDFGDGHTDTSKNPVHAYSADGNYLARLTVNGESACPDSASRYTRFESPLGELLYVPNSFTPNGDGLNDEFKISVFRPCEQYSIVIFNRWGQIVFESEDAGNAVWDGTFKSKMAEEGVYVYLLKSDTQQKKGVAYLTR